MEEEQAKTTNLTREQPQTLSKPAGQAQAYAGLGAAITTELMVGFWFGTGVILAIKMVNSLDCCIEELMSRN